VLKPPPPSPKQNIASPNKMKPISPLFGLGLCFLLDLSQKSWGKFVFRFDFFGSNFSGNLPENSDGQ